MGKSATVAKNKWNANNYDSLRIVVKKGQKEIIRNHAESKGMSLNGYINHLIEQDMKQER